MVDTLVADRKDLDAREAGKARSEADKFDWRPVSLAAVVFCTALGLGLAVALSRHSLGSAFIFDSGRYLTTALALYQAIEAVSADPSQLLFKCKMLSEHLFVDGPVITLLGCIPYWIAGSKPSLLNMQPVLASMAVYHALTAAGVFYLGRAVTASNKFAFIGGIIWAYYPAALVGTTKFLTELPTCLLEVTTIVLALALWNRRERLWQSFLLYAALGACFSISVLLKPIVVPGILGVCLLPAISTVLVCKHTGRSRLAIWCLAAVAGATITMTPWLAYSKAVTGDFSVSFQRQPVLNLMAGFDLQSDGRESPRSAQELESVSTISAITTVVQSSIEKPLPHISMITRKFSRMWSKTWNTYRFKVLGIGVEAQQRFHLLLISLGLLGMIAAAHHIKSRGIETATFSSGGRLVCLACLWMIAVHLLYLAFVGSPRYVFTAMPFLVVFASFFLSVTARSTGLSQLAVKSALLVATVFVVLPADIHGFLVYQGLDTGLAIVFSVLLKSLSVLFASVPLLAQTGSLDSLRGRIASAAVFSLLVGSLAALDTGSPAEYKIVVAPGELLTRTVRVEGPQPDWALVLLDADKPIKNASIKVNGHELNRSPRALYRFSSQESVMSSYQLFSSLQGMDCSKLRQWQALSVPVAWLAEDGTNTISVVPTTEELSFFGSLPGSDNKLRIPSLFGFSFAKLAENVTDLEARIPLQVVKATEQQSTITIRDKHDKQLPGLVRLLLVCGFENDSATRSGKAIPGVVSIWDEDRGIKTTTPGQMIYLRSKPLKASGAGTLKISLDGACQAPLEDHLSVKLVCRRLDRIDGAVNIFDQPLQIDLKPQQDGKFHFSDFIPLSAISNCKFSLEAALQSRSSPVKIQSLSCLLEQENTPDFRDSDLIIL